MLDYDRFEGVGPSLDPAGRICDRPVVIPRQLTDGIFLSFSFFFFFCFLSFSVSFTSTTLTSSSLPYAGGDITLQIRQVVSCPHAGYLFTPSYLTSRKGTQTLRPEIDDQSRVLHQPRLWRLIDFQPRRPRERYPRSGLAHYPRATWPERV